MIFPLLLLYLLHQPSCVRGEIGPSDIVDLSHPLCNSTIYWPGMPVFNRTLLRSAMLENGVWIAFGAFSTGEHGGTHLDAPNHFSRDGKDLSEISLDMAVAPGVHIDVSKEVNGNPRYMLTLDRVKRWESDHGPIPQRAAVLVNFGWSVHWPDPVAYFHSEDVSNPSTFSFPYIDPEVSSYLLDQRNIKLLGVDTASPDTPGDRTFPIHVMMLPRNRLLLENTLIPSSLPARGFTLHAAPLKIIDGTGVQTRVYAILDQNNNGAPGLTCLRHESLAFAVVTSALVAMFLGK